MLLLPATAEAQRRGSSRGHGRTFVVVSGSFGYPSLWYYDQWGPWGPWGPYGPGPFRPYPYGYRFDEFAAAIRFDVEPKDAEVYVNGSFAGEIDDYDGLFQRLRLRPGSHEIVVYRQGYRSFRDSIYVEPYQTRKLRFDLERLGPGELQEPRPRPSTEPADQPGRARPEGRVPDRRMPPPPPEPRESEPTPAQFGTLSVRVVPADAEIYVDGERWTGPAESDRLSIRLAAGRHRIEVRKPGLTTYAEEVLIRPGATLTLNVSLK